MPVAGALALHLVITLRLLPTFAKLYADFHAQPPAVTRLALSTAWTFGWAAWLVLGGGVGLVRFAAGRRPGVLLGVLGSTAAVWIVSLFALYLPIFTMAGAIR